MTFEEWWNETEQYDNHGDPVKAAWEHQQNRIEKLEWHLTDVNRSLKEQKQINSLLCSRLEALQEESDDI